MKRISYLKKHGLLFSIFIILAFTLTSCTSKEANNSITNKQELNESSINKNFILRPSFETSQGTLEAGTAFAVKVEEEENPIIITAMHLFGPDGGLEEEVFANYLPNFVKKAQFNDAFEDSETIESSKVVLIPEAKPIPEINKDIAAFIADKDAKVSTAEIYAGKLKVGETVWLAASVLDGEPQDKKLHKAVVTISNEKMLEFKYENPNLNLRATSGAPILNSEGMVVGINLSVYNEGKDLIGIANPSISFHNLLVKALGDKK